MRFTPFEQRVFILKCLSNGLPMRAAARISKVSRTTVARMLRLAGRVCLDFQRGALIDLPCKRLQCDEIWSFIHTKEKNLPHASNPPKKAGDIWTWVALCSDTKLVPTWYVGNRTTKAATRFMMDLQPRLRHRVQLTTDGHSPYLYAVEEAFGGDIDFSQIVKAYNRRFENKEGECGHNGDFIRKRVINGNPDDGHISTSHVERQNLTKRQSMRRLSRRTNGFSRRLEYHKHQTALHFMVYNFCRIHSSLRVTPAMAAGVTERLWSEEDIVLMMEGIETKAKPRGSYVAARQRRAAAQGRATTTVAGRRKRRLQRGRRVIRRVRSGPPSYVLQKTT